MIAYHSAERILDILAQCLCYPGLSHLNNLRNYPGAMFSSDALAAHKSGQKVLIEHVSPHRALTRLAIEQVESGASDADLTAFVKGHYTLALLTPDETDRLNRVNRSRMAPDRLHALGIVVEPNGKDKATG